MSVYYSRHYATPRKTSIKEYSFINEIKNDEKKDKR